MNSVGREKDCIQRKDKGSQFSLTEVRMQSPTSSPASTHVDYPSSASKATDRLPNNHRPEWSNPFPFEKHDKEP